jgi:hypothetical protein
MKNNILNWIKSHSTLVIVILIIFIMMKGCKSCSTERRHEYNTNRLEFVIDSLNTELKTNTYSADTNIRNLYDTIHSLRAENTILKGIIKDIQQDKEHYRKVNTDALRIIKEQQNDTIK